MEASVAEYLVYLKENASQLRKQAEEWGFTEQEINQCIEEALASTDNATEALNSPINTLRKWFRYFRVLVRTAVLVVCLLVALIAGVIVLTTYHEPTERFVSASMQSYNYPIFRAIRLATLPLHNMFNISEYYDSECILDNPFYVEDYGINCDICAGYRNVKTVHAANFSAPRFNAFSQSLKPVKIMGALDKHVGYQDLRKMFLEDRDELSNSFYLLQSTDTRFRTAGDVFIDDNEKYINTTQSLHIHWESHTVSMSVALRSLYPRPSFIPDKSEVNIAKHVLIDGPKKTTYKLPTSAGQMNMYIQSSGARRVLLRPLAGCQDICNSLIAMLNPGDALMYHYELWNSFAVTNGNNTSVGYIISVNP